MEPARQARGFHRIRNKVLAVLVAVAVLPAVAVSLYALDKTSDSLAEQALTLISESCITDARRTADALDSVQQQLAELSSGRADAVRLLELFLPDPRRDAPGERRPVSDADAEKIERAMNAVDQRLRRMLEQQPTCLYAVVTSLGFGVPDGTPVLRVELGGERRLRALVERDGQGFLRPVAAPAEPPFEPVLEAFRAVRDRQTGRDVLRAMVRRPELGDGEALEVFAARVQSLQGEEFGWIFLVHSWRRLLRELHAEGDGGGADAAKFTVLDAARGLEPVASSRPGPPVGLPDQFGLRDHARSLHANAALFESGEVVAFAPFAPRADEPDLAYVLASERPASELVASVRRFQIVFTGVLAAALLLAVLVGLWFARRLTKPLEELRDGAIAIGRGQLAQRIEVTTGDEAEELARQFNAMAGELRSLYEGMERTIAERTEQLQEALDDLRRAHDRIVDSERRYSDIVENASDLIQVTDAQGRIVSANRRQAERLGLAAESLQGRDFLELVAPDARDATRRAFDHVLAGGTLRAFDSALLEAGGGAFPVEISATPVVEDGKAVGVRAILRDASERKAMEARLIKAERLSSVGALAAGVAHEINNPLGIITMMAQRTLEKARKGELEVAKLEKIVEQGKRVAAITRNLLDFARAAPTRFAPFPVADAVHSACALVADRAAESSIALRQAVAPGLRSVVGNAQQISQVLLNLLLNAMQAIGKEGRIEVRAEEVETSRLPTAGRAVRITVEDDGPGIPPDVLPRLFEPFFTTKAPGEGTGLGLSVSYGIVKEHHGALFAENRPEGGARFELELPLEGSAEPAETKRPSRASSPPAH